MKEFCAEGHYYSIVPDMADMDAHYKKVDDARLLTPYCDLRGIELNIGDQKELINTLENNYYVAIKNYLESTDRRFVPNGMYSCADVVFLYYMLRELRPKRIIEVGCGYSSALMLDVNERDFNDEINITFIDPDFTCLDRLIGEKYKNSINVKCINAKVQDIPVSFFKSLGKNDILFLDTTHVSKAGSDVNFLLFEVLPILAEGVYIHFHDIFYPFDIPKTWIKNGYYWNENYILRAFLQNNEQYQIRLFTDLAINILEYNAHKILNHPYGIGTQYGGASLWLEKIA